jgi:hypothetical protein
MSKSPEKKKERPLSNGLETLNWSIGPYQALVNIQLEKIPFFGGG